MPRQTGILRAIWGANFLLAVGVFLLVFAAVGLFPRSGAAGPPPPEPVTLPDSPEPAPLNDYAVIWKVPGAGRPVPPRSPPEPPLASVVALRGATLGVGPAAADVVLEDLTCRPPRQMRVRVGESVSLGGVTITVSRVFTDPETGRTTAILVTAGGVENRLTLR